MPWLRFIDSCPQKSFLIVFFQGGAKEFVVNVFHDTLLSNPVLESLLS